MRCHRLMLSPLGILTLVADEGRLTAVLPGPPENSGLGTAVGLNAVEGYDAEVLEDAEVQLLQYFEGSRCGFKLPLAVHGTAFQRDVWDAVQRISYGWRISYKDLAVQLGDAAKARSVGVALARNPLNIIIPTHRVVGSRGNLTGYTGGLNSKLFLLEHEAAHLAAHEHDKPAGPAGDGRPACRSVGSSGAIPAPAPTPAGTTPAGATPAGTAPAGATPAGTAPTPSPALNATSESMSEAAVRVRG
ncbi:Methylated-DNA--protein-cysteine methyltransferase, constitutive [Arthrobacter saudimassiliensis]|uniref:methylated-DNA--[protein]-cysteine S-methyltransferase n=1 Tax=Arthrobacter saudimassiliensis TaxID=1461584 RepID=A0A078MUA9_9MICC|nr:Methylated-DNA--protein-cysteine methyltransferase, constitutive [Arthrobacter saudimassiliensis]